MEEESEEEVSAVDGRGLKAVRRRYLRLDAVEQDGPGRETHPSSLNGRTVEVTAGPAGSPGVAPVDNRGDLNYADTRFVREPASMLPEFSLSLGQQVEVDAAGLLSLVRFQEMPFFTEGTAELRLLEVTELEGEEMARIAVHLPVESQGNPDGGIGAEELEVQVDLSKSHSLSRGDVRSVTSQGPVRLEMGA